ncbi:hypothetical protein BHT95_16065 [Bacillus paralicheniformis]|nr:hypothetical protein BHT95_16065 [Bacillus paralicheniformis]TWM56451.1 hypothetical protein CHCC14814_2432 [Bacillus paralicheniformis]
MFIPFYSKNRAEIQRTLREMEINCHHLYIKNIVSRVLEKPHKKNCTLTNQDTVLLRFQKL